MWTPMFLPDPELAAFLAVVELLVLVPLYAVAIAADVSGSKPPVVGEIVLKVDWGDWVSENERVALIAVVILSGVLVEGEFIGVVVVSPGELRDPWTQIGFPSCCEQANPASQQRPEQGVLGCTQGPRQTGSPFCELQAPPGQHPNPSEQGCSPELQHPPGAQGPPVLQHEVALHWTRQTSLDTKEKVCWDEIMWTARREVKSIVSGDPFEGTTNTEMRRRMSEASIPI